MKRNCMRTVVLGLLVLLVFAETASAQEINRGASGSAASSGADVQVAKMPGLLLNSPSRFGLGLNVGNRLTGVSAKLWAASAVAFQAALGESPDGNNLRCHLDLLFSVGTWTSADGHYLLPAYLGVGGVFGHDFSAGQYPSSTEGGFRVPVGMSVLVRDNPVELFFEVAPEFAVRSNATLRGKYTVSADGAIGARYYF